jgi:hypothetical protein
MFLHNNLSSIQLILLKFYHNDSWHRINVQIDFGILDQPISKQEAPKNMPPMVDLLQSHQAGDNPLFIPVPIQDLDFYLH